jgi:hypothetical protein
VCAATKPGSIRADARQVAQQAVEQPDVGAGLDRQVQIRQFAGSGAARIDHDDLQAGPRLLGPRQALEQDRVAPGQVGADQHHHVGVFDIVVMDRHHVFAEGALVAGHGGGHAQARVGIDVGAADVALNQLVGHVVVFGQQLAGNIERHRIRAVLVDDGTPLVGHMVERFAPCHALQRAIAAAVAHHRMQQASFQADGLAQRRAFHAQAPLVGGMPGVAGNLETAVWARRRRDTTTNTAIGARRLNHEFTQPARKAPAQTRDGCASTKCRCGSGSGRSTRARPARRRTARRP